MSTDVTQREVGNNSGAIMRGLDQGLRRDSQGTPVGELAALRRHRLVSAEAEVALVRVHQEGTGYSAVVLDSLSANSNCRRTASRS